MIRMTTFGAVAWALAGATGCTDLKPLQAQVDDLKQQVARISSDQSSLKAAVDNTAHTASSALSAAQQAQIAPMRPHQPRRQLSRAVMRSTTRSIGCSKSR
jgi:outer membrane murein-binding lipoprotein Lpp